MTQGLVFSFDMGSGSLGECVRRGAEVKHIDALLLPSEFASTKTSAAQRRMHRTWTAHKARENWWKKCAAECGLPVLETAQPTKENPAVKPDPRMLREFAAPGDDTLYASCLLRIALLEGKKLEGWQIYKAIWSAMQHRGYDKDIPWKTTSGKKEGDEKDNAEAVNAYNAKLIVRTGTAENYHYPEPTHKDCVRTVNFHLFQTLTQTVV